MDDEESPLEIDATPFNTNSAEESRASYGATNLSRYNFKNKKHFPVKGPPENENQESGKVGRIFGRNKHVPRLQIQSECNLTGLHKIPETRACTASDVLKPREGSLNLAFDSFDKTIGKVEIRCSKRRRTPFSKFTNFPIEEMKEQLEELNEIYDDNGNRIEPLLPRSSSKDAEYDDDDPPAASCRAGCSGLVSSGKWAKYVLKIPSYLLTDPGRIERLFTQANIKPSKKLDHTNPPKPAPSSNSYSLAQALLEYVMVDPDPESEEVTTAVGLLDSACALQTHPNATPVEVEYPPPIIHHHQIGNDKLDDEISTRGIVGIAHRLLGKQQPVPEYGIDDVRPVHDIPPSI